MGSDAVALFQEALRLPADERASLAVKLLATVDEPAVGDTADAYEAWLRRIERRLDALVSGEDSGEDWDEIHRVSSLSSAKGDTSTQVRERRWSRDQGGGPSVG